MLKELVDAVIRIESNGDPKAVSPAGAKGLMQLMDPTGREWHAKLYNDQAYDPFNPSMNRTIGTAYLYWLLGRTPTLRHALAAYNWGIGNLRRLMKNATDIEKAGIEKTNDFASIEAKLPKETRDYVKKVLAEYKRNLTEKVL